MKAGLSVILFGMSATSLLCIQSEQTLLEPFLKLFIFHIAAGDTRYDFNHNLIIFDKFTSAALHEQFSKIQGCALVRIYKTMIGDDTV